MTKRKSVTRQETDKRLALAIAHCPLTSPFCIYYLLRSDLLLFFVLVLYIGLCDRLLCTVLEFEHEFSDMHNLH